MGRSSTCASTLPRYNAAYMNRHLKEERLMPQYHGQVNCATEWSYCSQRPYERPFDDVQLDVLISGPSGQAWRVPTYWAGDGVWRVRFSAPGPGDYAVSTVCSDADNADLHGVTGTLHVRPYAGDNPLMRHGPIQVAENRRTFEHADGTPFLWLGDTWWMGLTRRLIWPDEYQMLTADRVAKGYNVVQIVAGLYPDMPAFDERGFSEAGHPWEPEYAAIRPTYFDNADLRIQWLVGQGIVPCIVACWGYHLHWLGEERLKQHWRYLIARWGAYPVVWVLAGEGAMPYYLSEDKERDTQVQMEAWTRIGTYVREADPFQRPVTIHPGGNARDTVVNDSILDYDMLQTGHGGMGSAGNTLRIVSEEYARQPHMPVVEGEVAYEGILEGSRQEVQRAMYWICMLNGAAGFTYGANGIWQLNGSVEAYGPSPHGSSWGDTPWTEAYRLPGSTQVGVAKGILERYPWWRMTPHPEWVSSAATVDDPLGNHAAGIPGELRIIYFCRPFVPWAKEGNKVLGLEPDVAYDARFYSPIDGHSLDLGRVKPGTDGAWAVPNPGVMHDWVLVLTKALAS